MTVELKCTRCESPVERDDLRCPICNQAVPDSHRTDLPTAKIEILRCSGCGVAVSYSVKSRAPKCAFCGSVVHIETPDDPMEQADLFLPFTVDRTRAEAAYRSWLGTLGWFRPSDLSSASKIESLRPLWWVGWVFDAQSLVSWTADSNNGAKRANWAPHAGQAELEFDDILVPASRGLTNEETAHLTPTYRLETAVSEADEDLPDAVVEQFDLRRSSARTTVADAIRRLADQRIRTRSIPGTRWRNVHTSVLLRGLVTRRCSFPAWVLAYRYRNRLYRTVISGQDAESLIGNAPYSKLKIAFVIGAAALAAMALGCLQLVGLFS